MTWIAACGQCAIALLLLAGVGWWRMTIAQRNATTHPPTEVWEQIREQYPTPPSFQEDAMTSDQLFQKVLEANPFSPDRRPVSQPDHGEGGEAQKPVVPLPPKFFYKGRMKLGQHERAMIEESRAHKTYFLEVGQEVAGFKVLDIVEKQVLLLDLKNNEQVTVPLASVSRPEAGGHLPSEQKAH